MIANIEERFGQVHNAIPDIVSIRQRVRSSLITPLRRGLSTSRHGGADGVELSGALWSNVTTREKKKKVTASHLR